MRSLPPSPSTTSRAFETSRWRRRISLTWPGVTNMARTLVLWSARPIQPLMRTLVRPQGLAPGSTAERSPVREADQRVVRVEAGDHHLADLARLDRVAGAGADDLEQQAFLEDHARRHRAVRQQRLVGDQAKVGAAVHLRHRDAALLQRGAQDGRQVLGADLRFLQARRCRPSARAAFSTISLRNEGVPT